MQHSQQLNLLKKIISVRLFIGVFFAFLLLLCVYSSLPTAIAATSNQFTIGLTVVADAVPPTLPTGLIATTISSSQIDLSWTASTDNVAISGYVVRRDGGVIAKKIYTHVNINHDIAGDAHVRDHGEGLTIGRAAAYYCINRYAVCRIAH